MCTESKQNRTITTYTINNFVHFIQTFTHISYLRTTIIFLCPNEIGAHIFWNMFITFGIGIKSWPLKINLPSPYRVFINLAFSFR